MGTMFFGTFSSRVFMAVSTSITVSFYFAGMEARRSVLCLTK